MSTALLVRSAKRDSGVRDRPLTAHAHPDARKQSRWRALDGVRALAVIGVILYHCGVAWIPGGLLGVDVFFVLSGYLITSLLLREVRGGGRVDLRAFWARRARRLLPALLLVLIAVMLWAALDRSLDIRSIRLDVASSLLYAANWRFAFSHQGYFSSAVAPSPVLHLWSLGVEEQFYLLWPLLVGGVVGVGRFGPRLARVITRRPAAERGNGRRSVFVLALVGTAASTGWLVYGALHGTDASRLYYGTDTRALALLTGAALACCLPLPHSPRAVRTNIHAVRRWSLVGALALGGLLAIFFTVSGQSRLLYRGGFLVVAVLVALVIATLIRAPRGPLSKLLGLPPLAHIGRISYGLYLWHWPVILYFNGARTHMTGTTLLLTRIAISLSLAEVSYWVMERPVLGGSLPGRRLATAGLVSVVLLGGIAGPWSVLPRASDANQADFAHKLDAMAQQQAQEANQLTQHRVTTPKPTPSPSPTPPPVLSSKPGVLPGGKPYVPPNIVPAEPLNVLLVGDSTAWSAGVSLNPVESAWKVNLIDDARIGCGIAPGVGAGDGDQAPVKYGECWNWPSLWQQTVAVQKPDVSLLVLGHWEVVNRNVGGKVMHIGMPVYDNLLKAQFERAVQVLGSAGGKVAIATAPCYLRPERPDGTYWPQDDCSRVRDFNKIVWAVAAEHPSNVVVLDLYQFFSPDGKWHLDIGGHQVRDPDGIHFNIYGGQWLAPVFLGGIRELMGLTPLPAPPTVVKLNSASGG
jgi:peptidoglycan/LPS O-acetylase OafA/YrhL